MFSFPSVTRLAINNLLFFYDYIVHVAIILMPPPYHWPRQIKEYSEPRMNSHSTYLLLNIRHIDYYANNAGLRFSMLFHAVNMGYGAWVLRIVPARMWARQPRRVSRWDRPSGMTFLPVLSPPIETMQTQCFTESQCWVKWTPIYSINARVNIALDSI